MQAPKSPKQARARAFHEDDGGFSTVGMALALLVTLSLLFGATQVYRVQSACAEAQNVADAAALAAENQVASFYVVAQVCDCVSLSLSLAGTVCLGAGVVALCVPAAQPAGDALLKAAQRLFDARDRFARSAAAGLNRLQRLLPFLAAAQAAGVAAANGKAGQAYVGMALLVPWTGKDIAVSGLEEAGEALSDVLGQQEGIKQAASQSEAAAAEADEHKLRAFMADCGSSPGYCMYERAATLAGMTGSSNPHYSSVDAWSFGVGLLRAREYYACRFEQEAPADASVEECAASALRKRFYAYACDQLAQGYVYESAESFEAYFPSLPRNTEQMRATWLYTEGAYPLVESGEGQAMLHAWEGCPQVAAGEFLGMGSVEQAELEGLPTCPECGMCASRLGKVAAASTSIANGFEHHYLILGQEAQAYQAARQLLESQAQQAKAPVSSLLEKLGGVVSSAAKARIEASPPGRVGAIAVVLAPGGADVASLAPSSFVEAAGTLGTRVAVSGATLANDQPAETGNVISSLADGLAERAAWAGALPQVAARAWGGALSAYTRGHDGLLSAVRQALDALPLVGRAGLGAWASGKLEQAIAGAGYAPAQLAAYKPVTVNTWHVAAASDEEALQSFVRAKQAWEGRLGDDGGSAIAAAAGVVGGLAVERIADAAEGVVIARIQFFGDAGPSIDVKLELPDSAAALVSDGSKSLVDSAVEAIASLPAFGPEVRRWQ